MKLLLFSIFLLFASTYCFGQNEHLELVEKRLDITGKMKDYEDSVYIKLYKEFSEKPVARYTALPSFGGEYSFSIETNGGNFYIVSNCFQSSFWSTQLNNKEVILFSEKTKIDSLLYFKIVELFQFLAQKTIKTDKNRIGFDGTSYFFSSTNKNGEIVTGKTWSPNRKSALKKLIQICDEIYKLGNGKINAKLISKIDLIKQELN